MTQPARTGPGPGAHPTLQPLQPLQPLQSLQPMHRMQPRQPGSLPRPLPLQPGFGQAGQALTEFLLISLALIPLFLLIPMIGKYQDIGHATQLASRYAAFDALLRNGSDNSWKPPATLAAELRQRFFGIPGAAVVTDAQEAAPIRNSWNDPYQHPLIASPAAIALSFGARRGETHADGYDHAPSGDTDLFMLASRAGLASTGLYRANVGVSLASLPAGLRSIEPFDRLKLRIERHASVLPGPWTAVSPEQTEMRTGGLAPLNTPMPNGLISAAIEVVDMASVRPPAFGKLGQWRDVVPGDRLRSGETR